MTVIRSTPTLTTCELCNARMAAVRGPYSPTIKRAIPPNGYRLGYIAEQRDRWVPMCRECLDKIIATAA